mgnify:CR=1 FL=1
MKREISLFRYLTLGLFLAVAATLTAVPEVLFSPFDTNIKKEIVALIDKVPAKKPIDIAMYSMADNGPLADALKRAVDRGCPVRLVYNDASLPKNGGALSSNARTAQKIAQLGVKVYTVSNTMHEKYALLGDRVLETGSGNWSDSTFTKYSENFCIFQNNKFLFDKFREEFDYLVSRSLPIEQTGQAGVRFPEAARPELLGQQNGLEVYFTTQNKKGQPPLVAGKIMDLMRTAKSSIDIAVAHFNFKALAEELIALRKANPNLKIRVLLDNAEASDKKSRSADLEAGGVPVRYKVYSMAFEHPRAQLQHHKFVVIDNQVLGTGSYNWSETAEFTNYENFMILDGRKHGKLLAMFRQEFERLWDLHREIYPKVVSLFKASSVLPIHFDTKIYPYPMSLVRSEYQALRGTISAVSPPRNSRGSTRCAPWLAAMTGGAPASSIRRTASVKTPVALMTTRAWTGNSLPDSASHTRAPQTRPSCFSSATTRT